ncbi:hypothetical protein EXU85_29425 [Spirosoma sp. KCTC 42546]|uniref:hypothetical protein n=1 Tax=Spirosoma sp. KCTC 42546 TaxID=2520506 RepID=UPI0011574525|nr:hypothetical protein [Spirosoma sp. KCTC 42546]QDK82507.1 hypothetical protein EXU85_29425 [Spirosoma sp. KCTC 42546]
MARPKSTEQQINDVLELLADTNRMLKKLSPETNRLMYIQEQRLKGQYQQQLIALLDEYPSTLVVSRKRPAS